MMQSTHKDKSLGELFTDLSRETSHLFRQEVQLAKTEISANISRTVKNAVKLVLAVFLALFAMQALLAAAILALVPVVGPWQAALIVAGALLVIAAILAMMGLSAMKKSSLAPKETVQTIREDVQWAKNQM
jgi:uncharacterized membrane protein YqjE